MSGALVLRGRIAVCAVLAILAFPAGAIAAGPGTPLTPGLPQNPASSPTTAPAPAAPVVTGTNSGTAGGSTLSGGSATGIAIGALVVLAGISLFIWRDARKRAPVRSRAAVEGPDGRPRSKPKAKPRKLSPAERRRRKRGKAR